MSWTELLNGLIIGITMALLGLIVVTLWHRGDAVVPLLLISLVLLSGTVQWVQVGGRRSTNS